jgi:AraC-like DNA-binding protein
VSRGYPTPRIGAIAHLVMDRADVSHPGAPSPEPEDRLARIVVSDGEASGPDAFELWHETARPIFEPRPAAPLPSYRYASEFYDVDGLIFSRVAFSPTSYDRSREHVRGGEHDFITLHLPLSGAERGVVDGEPLAFAPDRITLQDWSRPYATTAEATEKIGIIIPRDRIEASDWIHERRPTMSWALRASHGRLLAGAVLSTWSQLPRADQSEAPHLAAGLLGMLNGLVGAEVRGSGRAPVESGGATLGAMRRWLDERLHVPGLDAEALADAFHCSRSTVYRVFADSPGVAAYIREQRLRRCHEELTNPTAQGRRVYEIAERWGFRSSSHFNRVFKDAFGLSPSESAHLAGPGDDTTTTTPTDLARPIDSLHAWLNRR